MKMTIFRSFLAVVLLCISSQIQGQSKRDIQHQVNGVYVNLIQAIGQISQDAPTLTLVDSEISPARFFASSNSIEFEYKAYALCQSLGRDSLNAIAFILAHELAHCYKNHSMLAGNSNGYSSSFAEYNSLAMNSASDSTHVYEQEADLFSCFYSKIAGYSIKNASHILSSIYKGYSLPEKMIHYPDLSERIALADAIQKEAVELNHLYDLATLMLLSGEPKCAAILYKYLLNSKFGSREIFNNAGIACALEGLQYSPEASNAIILPFVIETQSRLNELDRGFSQLDSAKASTWFMKAKNMFEKSIILDKSYIPSHINLAILEALTNQFEDAFHTLSKARKITQAQGIFQSDIEYAAAIIADLQLGTGAFDSLRACAVLGMPKAINALQLIDSKKLSKRINASIEDQDSILTLKTRLNKQEFSSYSAKLLTGEGNVAIYSKISEGTTYLLMEFIHRDGFHRLIKMIETDSESPNIQLFHGTFQNAIEYKQEVNGFKKQLFESYSVIEKTVNEQPQLNYIIFN